MGELTAFDDEPAMSRKTKDGAGQKKTPYDQTGWRETEEEWVGEADQTFDLSFFLKHDIVSFLMDGVRV
jgi:hypothetical protein